MGSSINVIVLSALLGVITSFFVFFIIRSRRKALESTVAPEIPPTDVQAKIPEKQKTMVSLSMMMQTVLTMSLLCTSAGIYTYHQLWAPEIRTYDVREQLRLLTIEAMQTNMSDSDMEKNIRLLESNASALPGNIVVIEKGAVVGKKKDEIELHFPTDRKEKKKNETPDTK